MSVSAPVLVRSSFFVGSGSGRVRVPFRRVVGVALVGGCFSWSLAESPRSFSGCVVRCLFLSRSVAAAFGSRASAAIGFAVAVRPAWVEGVGACWSVSVPCVR